MSVIRMKGRHEVPLRRREQKRWGDGRVCPHTGVMEVDGASRRVYCVSCEEEVDPVTILLQMADNWGRYDSAIKGLKAELKEIEVQAEAMKRDLRNMTVRMKRAVEKEAESL